MANFVPIIIKVILAALLAVWLYRDSRGRDYSWILWTLVPFMIIFVNSLALSVIFALLVVIFYLIFRPKGAMIRCPKCNKPIHEILTICPFCHKEAKRECLNCHEPVPWDAEQCPFCKSRALTKGD